jgi:hypothetical protein
VLERCSTVCVVGQTGQQHLAPASGRCYSGEHAWHLRTLADGQAVFAAGKAMFDRSRWPCCCFAAVCCCRWLLPRRRLQRSTAVGQWRTPFLPLPPPLLLSTLARAQQEQQGPARLVQGTMQGLSTLMLL